MARVYALDGIVPVIHPSAFVHPTAVLIGDAIVGPGCYVGPGAVMRGDFGRVAIEEGSNLQDTCVMHGFPGSDTVVEADGHVGHGAILHGCRIGRGALVGMGAVVMDGAVVGEEAFVGALAFIGAKVEVPPRMLAAGVPARVLRPLTEQEIAWKAHGTRTYQDLARRCRDGLVECEPLTEPEPGRRRFEASALRPLSDTKAGPRP